MHALLNDFFRLALAEVHRYEGTINQFLGDGFMALFGAPIAHEDDARRAVLAALAIQRGLLTREAKAFAGSGAELAVRMGLNVVHGGGTCDGAVQSQTREMDVVVRSELEGLSREDSEAAWWSSFLLSAPEAVFSSAEHHIDRAQHLGDVLWWQPCHALGEKGSIEGNDL